MNQETVETVKASGGAREVSGAQVEFGPGCAGIVRAGGNATVSKAGALAILGGQDVTIEKAGALMMASGKDMTMANGGTQLAIVGGKMTLTNGGLETALVGGSLEANHSFVGIALSPKTVMGEGSRLLLNLPLAIAFGLAFGAAYALIRRKKK